MRYRFLIPFLLIGSGVFFTSCSSIRLGKSHGESRTTEVVVEQDSLTGEQSYSDSALEVNSIDNSLDSSEAAADTSVAIDDYIWRELALAQEYCSMGVLANREAAWEEAEYYFEKSLAVLGELDIDTETDSLSEEAVKYNRILAELANNYRTTLVSLGHLSEDVSPDALLSRFSEINHIKIDSAQLKRLESYTQEKRTYNVPVIMNERVKARILYYQTVARDAFARYLTRMTKYMPMVTEIFEEYGLPSDLVYLAMVESGFNPHAYSWARAMGIWQFISETGRLYGLDRNWWLDERKDPVKSTHAAARFLKDLYAEFGSWELALAAYNGGPGRIRRTTKSQNTSDFWKLRLKKQTMDYVPFFMAAVMICKDPERFGFAGINYEPELVYDEVRISRSIELRTVANALGCSVEMLQDLNPELLRQFTPPNLKYYNLHIPRGTKEIFLAAYEEMPASRQAGWVQHRVARGESLASIARRYGVSEYALMEANNIARKTRLSIGKTLVIPVSGERTYSNSSPKGKYSYKDKDGIYVVRSGDTISDIAKVFGMTPEQLRRLNNLGRKSQIYVDQKLNVRQNQLPKACLYRAIRRYNMGYCQAIWNRPNGVVQIE
ncbi:MAG: transglycosylase SLT domain-containing protein [candidate division Zixibacteria bacterium]|nr:transglycosylase SLT domain-containing protein [candidate division Zixibacteria bacterium]